MFIRSFRYNRKEEREIEELWDLMIGGHAKNTQNDNIKNKLLNLVTNLASIGIAFVGMCFIIWLFNTSVGTSNVAVFLTFLVSLIMFPIIANVILRHTIKRIWLRLLLSVAIAFVIGLLMGLISIAL